MNPNLTLNSSVNLNYLFDGIGSNIGGELQFASGSSVLIKSISAKTNVTLSFQDNCVTNDATPVIDANGGKIQFNGTSLTSTNSVLLKGDIYINSASFRLIGTNYTLDPNIKLFTSGSINSPFTAGDAVVTISNTLYVGLLASTSFGTSFTAVPGSLTIDDLDSNSTTALYNLTLNGNQNQVAAWTLGGNLRINGNYSTNQNLNAPGRLTLNSNLITISSTVIWGCSVHFISSVFFFISILFFI